MTSVLSAKHFHEENAAYAFVEARVWVNGRVCPHCGTVDNSTPLKGKSTRLGVYKCKERECRKPFTVKVGTVFEGSNVKLHIWLQAIHLLCASKKGISANQLHMVLGVTLKTAWFLSNRIRDAMRSGDLAPFGAGGTSVEVGETFIGREPGTEVRRTWHHKLKVLTLVDRETGSARSMVVDNLSPATVTPILQANIAREARLMTDEAKQYIPVGRTFAEQGTTNHRADEYVSQTDPTVHSNTVEGYFSIYKRRIKGTYQHCAKRHPHRYMAEFEFRHSERMALGINDIERTDRALQGGVGKRLKCRDSRPW